MRRKMGRTLFVAGRLLEGDETAPVLRVMRKEKEEMTLSKDFRIKELEQQIANLEEYVTKGVAFRDELQANVALLQEALEKAETGSYRVDAGINRFLERWNHQTKGKNRHDTIRIDVLEDVVATLRTQRRAKEGEVG